MRSGGLALGFCITLFFTVTSAFSQDPSILVGTWKGDWGPNPGDRNRVTIVLSWDGKTLTGNVTAGEGVTEPIPIQKIGFDSKTGAVHMETESKNPRTGQTVHFMIDGKVEKKTMTGGWVHDNHKGDFKLKQLKKL
jgi:hypothetical protein